MLTLVEQIPIQQRDVEFPLRSNSCIGATPIRLDLDGDGPNDATRWLAVNCSWDPGASTSSIESFLIRGADSPVEREGPLPGKIWRVFGPTVVRLDRNADGLADSSFVFAGHFDPDCQMMWELRDDGRAEPLDALNRLTPENEGPHGIAFARIDRNGDGIPELTRVFYTGELTHRCTAYEIDDATREARVVCHFSEGDCCRSVLAQRLDLDGDGHSDTTRLFVSLIDLDDLQYGAVKIFDLPDDTDVAQHRAHIPNDLATPDLRITRATGTAAVRLDLDGDGQLDTTRYFAGSAAGYEGPGNVAGLADAPAVVSVFDVDEITCQLRHVANLAVEQWVGVVGTAAIRIDSDADGMADLTRVFVSLINRIAIFDVSDDGQSALRQIVDLYDYSMVYAISPLCIDTDDDGRVDKAYLGLSDTWANRLAIYELECAASETILAAKPTTIIGPRDDGLRFASDETPWGAGLYNFTNYERLRVYHIQIARDEEFKAIIHEAQLHASQPLSGQPRWREVTYDTAKGKAVTAYTIEAVARYSVQGLDLRDARYWRVRGCDPVAQTGWSSWAVARMR